MVLVATDKLTGLIHKSWEKPAMYKDDERFTLTVW